MAGTGGMMGTSGMGGGGMLTGACADADISAGGQRRCTRRLRAC